MAYTASTFLKKIIPDATRKVNVGEIFSTKKTPGRSHAEITKSLISKIVPHVRPPVHKTVYKTSLALNENVVKNFAKRGLYKDCSIWCGHNIREDRGKKSREEEDDRTGTKKKLNVQNKRLFSLILNRFIRVRATTDAIAYIDKVGGIDEYLLKTPTRRLDSKLAIMWKEKVENKYIKMSEKKIPSYLMPNAKKPKKQNKGDEPLKREVPNSCSVAESKDAAKLNA